MNANIDKANSYKTEANLDRAVATRIGQAVPGSVKYLTVCNRRGRFVAIFPHSWNRDIPISAIVHAGFMVIG